MVEILPAAEQVACTFVSFLSMTVILYDCYSSPAFAHRTRLFHPGDCGEVGGTFSRFGFVRAGRPAVLREARFGSRFGRSFLAFQSQNQPKKRIDNYNFKFLSSYSAKNNEEFLVKEQFELRAYQYTRRSLLSSGSIHTCIDHRLACSIVTLVVSDKNVKPYFPRKIVSNDFVFTRN